MYLSENFQNELFVALQSGAPTHRGVNCRGTSEPENIEVKECQNVISSKVWQLKEVEERLRAAIKTIDIRVTPEQFRRKPM